MKKPVFTGSCTAIVTPFRDGKVDYSKLGELVDLQADGGTSAIVVCGTTGENATQPLPEHIDVVDFVVKRSAGRMKVIAGVGSNDTMTSVFLTEHAVKSGVDGILMVTPYYNRSTQAGLIKHFSYVADRFDVPMLLYNVPSRTTVCIQAETYKELSKHPNINGVKEASGDFSLITRTLSLCGDELNVWSGNDADTVAMMALGAKGVISVASNIIPAEIAKICSLCLEEKFREAAALQLRYSELISKLFIEVNPIPIKTAMNLLGMDVGALRLPLCEMDPANLEKLKTALVDAGLKLR